MQERISGHFDEKGGYFFIETEDGARASLNFDAMNLNVDGTCAMLRSSGKKHEPTDFLVPWYRLIRIVVSPKGRRRGLGKRLLSMLASLADNKGFNLYCEADPYARTIPVRPLKRLFKSYGFFSVPRSGRLMYRVVHWGKPAFS